MKIVSYIILLLASIFGSTVWCLEGDSGDKTIHLPIRFISRPQLVEIPPHSTIEDIHNLLRKIFNLDENAQIILYHQGEDIERFNTVQNALSKCARATAIFMHVGLDVIEKRQQQRIENNERAFEFPEGYRHLETRAGEKLAAFKKSLNALKSARSIETRFDLLQKLAMNAYALLDSHELPPMARVEYAATLKKNLELNNDFFELNNVMALAQDEYYFEVDRNLMAKLLEWAQSSSSLNNFYRYLNIRLAQEFLKSQILWDYVEGARQQPVGTVYESPIPVDQLQNLKDFYIGLFSYGNEDERRQIGEREFQRQIDQYISFHNDPSRYSN